MTRRSLVIILSTLYLLGFAGYGYWAGNLWISSKADTAVAAQPQESGSVLGATTETILPTVQPTPVVNPYPVLKSDARKPVIGSRRFLLYHAETGKILLEKDATTSVSIASTTKLMTAYIIDDIGSYDELIRVSDDAAKTPGSTMGLKKGEIISTEALLYGLMLNSGNDAAEALAEHYGRKLLDNQSATNQEAVARFVAEMNSYAKKLNLTQTTYQDPAGLNDTGKSSALDLAKLTVIFNQRERLQKITATAQITVTGTKAQDRHDLRNSNRLVADFFYPGVLSGKTGYTEGAGHCLVSSAKQNGATLVGVVLSTYQETKEASAVEMQKLLDWGFSSFSFE